MFTGIKKTEEGPRIYSRKAEDHKGDKITAQHTGALNC